MYNTGFAARYTWTVEMLASDCESESPWAYAL